VLGSFPVKAQIRSAAVFIVRLLTANIVYTVQIGNTKVKRKGGVGFLHLDRRNHREGDFLSGLDLTGKNVYDIGAYIGILTSFFGKKVGSSGRVIAFEPNPDNYEELKKSIKLNDLRNVDAMRIAIGDESGFGNLAVRYNYSATSSLDPAIQAQILSEKRTGLLQVPLDTGDHCIASNKLPPPDFIKLDVEGLEFKALKGLDQTIRHYWPMMYIEIHGATMNLKIENITRIVEFLQSLKYQVLHVESQKNITVDNAELAAEGHIFCQK
jgi:FkbM family methyltransferase